MKLLKVDTLVQARERLLKAAKECLPETEQVALADASDRILAEDIVSGEMIPAFRRSSVDGYAVCSKDTAGATESIPVFLKVLEEVEIGHPAISKIEPGTCAYVPTGGMVPEGADAMVMVEYSERFGTDEVALYENVPYGKCIVLPGEDVKTGDIVLNAGTRIGPAQAGTLAALGVAFYDRNGTFIPHPTGGDLQRIERLQIPADFQNRVKGMYFTYACDVTNPYTGENGAAAVFGPQKGATPAQVQLLNNGMAHLAALLPNAVRALPGAGAAGGLCGGLYGVLGGSTQSGFDLLAALADLDSAIAGADLVITGEGRTDRQTLMGKLPYQVAQRAKKLGKRCVVISGDGDGTLVGDKVITLTDKDTPPRAAIAHAATLLAEKADLLLQ